MDRLPDELESVARIRHRVNGANEIKPRRRINWPAGFTITDDPVDEEADIAWSLAAIPGIDEYISDTAGAMVTGNTETGIAVTYQDSDNTIDYVVGVDGTTTEINGSNQVGVKDLGISTGKLANDAVSYAKIQNVSAASRILGRISSGAGDIEELTATGGVEFSGTGIRNAAISGDITIAAGSTSSAITSGVIVSGDFNSEAATSWTPTSVFGWTLNSGSAAGEYIKHGRLVVFSGVIIFAGDSSFSGAGFSLSGLPNSAPTFPYPIYAELFDASGPTYYPATLRHVGSGIWALFCHSNGTYSFETAVTSTVPFTWGNLDAINISGTYIATS